MSSYSLLKHKLVLPTTLILKRRVVPVSLLREVFHLEFFTLF